MIKLHPSNFVSYGLSGLVILLVMGISIWQGQYGTDPHHWGLMLGNAVDLQNGLLPYSEVFIQYGILTTLIQMIGLKLLGVNLLSLITVTAFFYALGLIAIQKIVEVLTGSKAIAIYALITCFLFHPLAIYPWSNYICFPFLMGGVLLLLEKDEGSYKQILLSKWFSNLLAGVLFGLACLSREGLLFAVILIMVSGTLLFYLQNRGCKKTALYFLPLILGFIFPLLLFFSYLHFFNLMQDWYKIAVLVPTTYALAHFPHVSAGHFWKPLAQTIGHGVIAFNPRWILIFFIILVNAYFLYQYGRYRFFKRNSYGASSGIVNDNLVLIALFSLFLLSSSLHLVEIFRLATGSIVGVACLYYFISLRSKLVQKILFISIPLLLLFQITSKDSGNYFFPSSNKLASGVRVQTPAIFNGQIWPPEVINYYAQVSSTLGEIQASKCSIAAHYNNTKDSLIAVMSPFMRYQLPPFFMPKEFDFLNSNFNIKEKLANPTDIVLFDSVDVMKMATFTPPKGFYVFKHFTVPAFEFLPLNNQLVVLLPNTCKRDLKSH
jgi:hypothetical protein